MVRESRGKPELERQLRDLRKGHGLTAAKLRSSDHVLDALGVSDPLVAEGLLKTKIDQLGKTPQILALRNAYCLDNQNPLLIVRRREFAEQQERHIDTIEAWENEAIRQLIASLHSPDDIVLIFGVAINDKRAMQHFSRGIERESKRKLDASVSASSNILWHSTALIYRAEPPIPYGLLLVVEFDTPPYPKRACFSMATDLYSLLNGEYSQPLDLETLPGTGDTGYQHSVVHPTAQFYYAILWEW
jgi:hypothetical protein